MELTEASRFLTAFTIGPLGFYECVQMPFSLTNAPATFQCLMKPCLGEMHFKWCIIYLDDIIVFSKTPEEHIQRLRGVLRNCLLLDCNVSQANVNFLNLELLIWDILFLKME